MDTTYKRHPSVLRGEFLLNVFMNEIFYFMEICDLVNYSDGNALSIITNTFQLVLSTL